MQYLRQNTAVIVTVGPFYDKTDAVTIETGLTITNERITLTADTDDGSAPTNILDNVTGATSGTSNDLNYITGNDAGMMQLELSAANTNRVGRMLLSITDAANHVPVFHEYFVLPQAIYDWITGVIVPLPANVTTIAGSAVSTSTAQLGVNLVNIAGSAVSTSTAQLGVNAVQAGGTAWGSGAITANSIASDAITAAKIADDAIATEHIATGAISADSFAAGAITATVIATGAIDADAIADNSIDAGAIATGAITNAKFAAGAIDAAAIADNAIDAGAIATGAITNAKFAAGAIDATAIANGAIDAATFAADVDAEVATYIWNAATASYGGAGTYGQAMEDTLADTNEVQGDLVNGGRLDLLIDGIKTKTDSLTFTVAGDVDCNVQSWAGAAAPAMTGDAYARLGAPAGASVSADIAAVKVDTAATLADTGTDGVVVAAASKTGYALTDAGVDAIWDRASSLTLSFETLLTRAYQMINNKMNVTDADGTVALRAIGDGSTIATGSVTDNSTTTTRLELTWA